MLVGFLTRVHVTNTRVDKLMQVTHLSWSVLAGPNGPITAWCVLADMITTWCDEVHSKTVTVNGKTASV